MTEERRKGAILVAVVALIIAGSLLFVIATRDNSVCKQFLRKYNWEPMNDVSGQSIVLQAPDDDMDVMQIFASQKAGLSPENFYGRTVQEFDYKLSEYGGGTHHYPGESDHIRAVVLVCDHQVVGAWLSFTEQNLRVRYWPVNLSGSDLTQDIRQLEAISYTG